MNRDDRSYGAFCRILREELLEAMGCTEPIAIALAAARARDLLGTLPTAVDVQASGSILKNAKSVVVPHTGGLKGIEAAVAAGIVAGRAEEGLQVIARVAPEQLCEVERYCSAVPIRVKRAETDNDLDITVRVEAAGGDESCGHREAAVRIAHTHTGIVAERVDGSVLFGEFLGAVEVPVPASSSQGSPSSTGCSRGDSGIASTQAGVAANDECIPCVVGADGAASADYSLLNMQAIWDFANTVELDDVQAVIERQIARNKAVAEEGLRGQWGASIGRVLLRAYGSDVKNKACAWAAAGSDARMGGCELPVVINSGSGNQGITVSVPLMVYAEQLGSSEEDLVRALVFANLAAIHMKQGIGRLSAFCGAVCAGAAAGAGIAFLEGDGYDSAIHALVNALSIVSGMVCDGAKPSCAAKIAFSVNAGILGLEMYRDGQQFYGGDGLVKKGVENTIESIGRLGRDGMSATNDEVIRIMLGA